MEADASRDVVRDHALETSAEPDAVVVIDETGFPKKGKASRGVGRQCTGSAGKITNYRVGVFAAYVSGEGHASIDRALYTPKEWTKDPARMRAAHVPEGVGFATEPQPAPGMIGRAIAAGVPFARVAADMVYGIGDVEMALRRAGRGHVLGASADAQFDSRVGEPEVSGTAEGIAHGLGASAWRRPSAGEGTKGPRLYDWAHLELADLGADEYNPAPSGTWTRGPLIRRDIADGGCAYFSTRCPAATTIEAPVAVEGRRWAIEDAFETAKTELGPDHNETRSRHGWYRHVSLVMLACAMLAPVALRRHHPVGPPSAMVRHHANTTTPPKTAPRLPRTRQPSSAGRSGRLDASRRDPSRPAAHPPRVHHRLVAVATRPPSRRATLTSETKSATVVVRRAGQPLRPPSDRGSQQA